MNLLVLTLSFPTVMFTVLLALSMLYWVFVLVGAVDLGGDGALEGADGALHGGHGALEGADGALEGADGALEGADGALEGADGALDGAEGAVHGGHGVEGAAKGAGDALDIGDSVLASFVSALKLRRAPITVVLSLFAAFGFLLSSLTVRTFFPAGVGWLIGTPIFLVSALVSLLMTSVAIRPLAPVFETKKASTHRDLIGKLVVVSTGHVTPTFGQATLDDGAAGLTLQVRADESAGLVRGDQCVIIDHDGPSDSFTIEIMPDVMSGRPRVRVTAKAVPAAELADRDAVEPLSEKPAIADKTS